MKLTGLSSRDSLTSDGETTADLSDKNCTGDELDGDHSHMPKVVSQSNGIGGMKASENNPGIKYDQVKYLTDHLIEINEYYFSRRLMLLLQRKMI